MSRPLVDPDLAALTSTLLGARAAFVVIGGFAVIANDYVRATEDIDLLIPDDPRNDHALDIALCSIDAHWTTTDAPFRAGDLTGREHSRVWTERGLVDLLREGAPPLDFATVHGGGLRADLGAGEFAVAGLVSLVAFKRLADRPRDRADLAELAEIHGELPLEPLPGIDFEAPGP
jgi:hypothetical protein